MQRKSVGQIDDQHLNRSVGDHKVSLKKLGEFVVPLCHRIAEELSGGIPLRRGLW